MNLVKTTSITLASIQNIYPGRGLLTGLVPHWWRDGHGFGVYVVLYEALLMVRGGRDQAGKMDQFWAGGLAGMICWLSVLPFDVVKSRLQVC